MSSYYSNSNNGSSNNIPSNVTGSSIISSQYQPIAQNKMQPIQMYQQQAAMYQQQQQQQQQRISFLNQHSHHNSQNMQIPQTEGTAKLNFFLQTAPSHCSSDNNQGPVTKLNLGNGETVCCTFWNGKHYITGTDIVRIITYRMSQSGNTIQNMKKYEEGIFSDLRNLKVPTDARLEEPRSSFLEFLHKNGAIRTQKKQKVFFWERVPHDELFRDCLERTLKKNAAFGQQQQMMMSHPWMMYMQQPHHQQQQHQQLLYQQPQQHQQQQQQYYQQQQHYQPQRQQQQQPQSPILTETFFDLIDEEQQPEHLEQHQTLALIDEIKPMAPPMTSSPMKGMRGVEPNSTSNLMTSLLNDGGNYDPLTDMMVMNGCESGGGVGVGACFDDEFRNSSIFFCNSIAPNM